jgi:hypothetical protein
MNRYSKRIVSIRLKRLARSPEAHNRVSEPNYTIRRPARGSILIRANPNFYRAAAVAKLGL